MNKIAGAILILAGAVAGHGVLVFTAQHPQIHRYDVPGAVANMVLVAIATSVVLAVWGALHIWRNDGHHH
ncbi:MAG: hypothetical protein AB7O59_21825 [Pirellulales bacterium]